MKRHILLGILAAVLAGVQFFVNCSSPLDGGEPNGRSPVDPIPDIDTVFSVDTVVVVDTLGGVDTVIIVNPDPDGSWMLCSRIASNKQDIVWMFRNQEGLYKLEFVAALESGHPTQILWLDIDGREFMWKPTDNRELITELYLGQNATIRIMTKKPPSLGHSIDICLTVSLL